MAQSTPPSNDRPLKASPEVIATPPKTAAGKAAEKLDPSSTSAMVSVDETSDPAANATFSNTNQHVADKQSVQGPTERFTNTKLNIALINDPKNGPRFTMTKKEAGLDETARSAKAKENDVNISNQNGAANDAPPPQAAPKAALAALEPAAEPAAAIGAMGMESSSPQANLASPASHPLGAFGVPPAAEPPSKVPVDSSKTFVGPNGTYYDESWRWMDWRGTKRSWNWPAALTFGHWFAYRRLYGLAAVYTAWLTALEGALVNNIHVGVVAGLLLLTLVLTGLYANTLYFQAFRRSVTHVTEKGEGSYDELKTQLAELGGVNRKAPWFMAATVIAGIALALVTTYFGRGGFLINIWPF